MTARSISVIQFLPAWQQGLLARARCLAAEIGTPLYLVGGGVRDLLLLRGGATETLRRSKQGPEGAREADDEGRDLDLVVEGDGLLFARRLARRLGGTLREHEAFGTAAVGFSDRGTQRTVDVATARRESYPFPGALPVVEAGSIFDDLRRRDFAINAMAIELAPGGGERLRDPCGGARDLRSRSLRVLHAGSFLDDPTRGFRAARFAARLGFELESRSRRWLAAALARGALANVSGTRLLAELRRAFAEPVPGKVIGNIADLGLSREIHPDFGFSPRARKLFGRVETELARASQLAGFRVRSWLVPLMALGLDLDTEEHPVLARRLGLSGAASKLFGEHGRAYQELIAALQTHGADSRSAASLICSRQAPETLLYTLARCRRATLRAAIRDYVARGRAITLSIGGGELVSRGIPPGPAIGDALAATLRARLDGDIAETDELDYATRWADRASGARS